MDKKDDIPSYNYLHNNIIFILASAYVHIQVVFIS